MNMIRAVVCMEKGWKGFWFKGSRVQLHAAFKVQVFEGSKVQLPAAFKFKGIKSYGLEDNSSNIFKHF